MHVTNCMTRVRMTIADISPGGYDCRCHRGY
ncbi:PTS transporter subunit EIIB [Klebsiella pneumoniae]|nr:PTS transporter subunit EIIB [Klebsiella pneumoniae]